MKNDVINLKGPILIIGGSGFIGSNLLKECLKYREDVIATYFSGDSWRLSDVPAQNLAFLNILDPISIEDVLDRFKPKTIFDCSSFGAYSFEKNISNIHKTNYQTFFNIIEKSKEINVEAYVHSGSSSEYGVNSNGPKENDELIPNSHYSVSKVATSYAIKYYGKIENFPVVNLRLYSVYGAYEDSSRLIPTVCHKAIGGDLPMFAGNNISRDFIYISDVLEAFFKSASSLYTDTSVYGESINIGTGHETKLSELAELSRNIFSLDCEIEYNQKIGRKWDLSNWVANPKKAGNIIGWEAKTSLKDGLKLTFNWWNSWLKAHDFDSMTKNEHKLNEKGSISAIIACYKDAEAIPFMYRRLKDTFNSLHLDYEIIFVNDCSPDNSADIIREISAKNPRVIGINHSRNFGSQAAFRSGMELASKEACVLLDGDLQDPPEVIKDFVKEWRAGADIVYGKRVKREMSKSLEFFYKLFYKIFSLLSDIPMPRDAGDFSLISREAMHWMLKCNEKDSFLRGIRAYVGFKQVAVEYVRPERMFGVSTNNWLKNIGWAKKGIFSFSHFPINLLTSVGVLTSFATLLIAISSVLIKLIAPDNVPQGVTFISLLVMFFGSFTILGLGVLGEYIGKIFDETKSRPAFIRTSIIKSGQIESAKQGNDLD